MLDQDDINNIYSDMLVLSKELDGIKKCINNMAMALRPSVTNIRDVEDPSTWYDVSPNKPPVVNGIRNSARKKNATLVNQTDLPWPENT